MKKTIEPVASKGRFYTPKSFAIGSITFLLCFFSCFSHAEEKQAPLERFDDLHSFDSSADKRAIADPSPQGQLIVFAGISGSGKSSLAKELAILCHGTCFSESEESEWPEFIRKKQPYGEFSSFVTFRSMRTDALWKAWDLRNEGKIAIMDSYYDKITYYYLGKPGMEWLMNPESPYFPCARMITDLDAQLLPNADCVILLDVPYDDWMQMLTKRGRIRDSIEGFQANYRLYRKYVSEAVRQICTEKHIDLLIFQPQFGDIHTEAKKLHTLLINHQRPLDDHN